MIDFTQQEAYLLYSTDASVRRRAALAALNEAAAAGKNVFVTDPSGKISGAATAVGSADAQKNTMVPGQNSSAAVAESAAAASAAPVQGDPAAAEIAESTPAAAKSAVAASAAPVQGDPAAAEIAESTPAAAKSAVIAAAAGGNGAPAAPKDAAAAGSAVSAVTFWDVYASRGLALRTTASELGPYLMAMLLELNDAQSDLLQVLYQIADDNGLLLIDTKDLRALINEVTENPESYEKTYGKVNGASASAILKAITLLEGRGGKDFLYEPAIDVRDFVGKGESVPRIHILDAQDLSADEGLYRVMLLYLLSECAENAEDADLSSLVLIIDDAGIVLGVKDKTFAGKMRSVLSRLQEREITVIFLAENETDVPEELRKSLLCAPAEETAEGTEDTKAITLALRKEILAADPLAEKYKVPFERDSAYEFLLRRGLKPEDAAAVTQAEEEDTEKKGTSETDEKAAKMAKRAKSSAQSLGTTVAGTVGRKIGKSIGENFGSFGSTLGANVGASIGRGIMKTFFGE